MPDKRIKPVPPPPGTSGTYHYDADGNFVRHVPDTQPAPSPMPQPVAPAPAAAPTEPAAPADAGEASQSTHRGRGRAFFTKE